MSRDGADGPTRTHRLLDRWRMGDREAERRLFERHRSALMERVVRATWMRGLHKWSTPEDLVDEVFLRALASGLLSSFQDPDKGALERALAKMLKDVAVDTYRRHGAQIRGEGREPLRYDHASEAEPSPLNAQSLSTGGATPTSNAREKELLELCETHLNARELEVWRLCEVRGLDSPTAASELGTSAEAVRGVRHRARKKMRALLERFGFRRADP